MRTLRILCTIISAVCIAAFLPVGSTLGWGYAAILAAAALCFFLLMRVFKQAEPEDNALDKENHEKDFLSSPDDDENKTEK